MYTPRQLSGRGQDGRRWYSPDGVFTASFVIVLAEPGAGARLSLAAGLAVAHLVEDLLPDARAMLKWPNDVYCRDRKLAGILCEARVHAGALHAVVGIGLNVAPRWDGDERFADQDRPPIGLDELGAEDPGSQRLIGGLRGYLLEAVGLLRDGRWAPLAEQLRSRDWLLGKPLTVTGRCAGPVHGSGAGIDDSGRLLLALGDGRMQAIDGGRVRAMTERTWTPRPRGAE